jgi:mono/diheme cytochrome c family protein
MPIRALTRLLSVAAVAAAGPALADGAKTYEDACAACHMPKGEGVEGAFPKLAGSPIVVGPAEPLADLLIVGRGGMPSFAADLSDAQLAEVLTYVRSSWGNQAGPLDKDAVAAARARNQPEARESLKAH